MDSADNPNPPVFATGFKGLNNRLDPTRLGTEYQLEAENVLCDDGGYYIRRPGFVAVRNGVVDIYPSPSGSLYLVTDAGVLIERSADGIETQRATGFGGAPFRWATLGYAVFCQGASAQWAIYPDRVIPWGSLCPTSSMSASTETDPLLALAALLAQPAFDPPPLGDVVGVRRNQLVVGVWESALDRSVLYFSAPDSPHCFDLLDFQLIPGKVVFAETVAGLFVVGTDRAIYVDDAQTVQQVADFGVASGSVTHTNNTLWMMTPRGFCSIPPFKNWTETALWPVCRRESSGAVLTYRGGEYFVALTQGFSRPTEARLADSVLHHFQQGVF